MAEALKWLVDALPDALDALGGAAVGLIIIAGFVALLGFTDTAGVIAALACALLLIGVGPIILLSAVAVLALAVWLIAMPLAAAYLAITGRTER